MITLNGKYSNATIFIDEVEEGVYGQVYEVINSDASKGLKVCIMPDTHVGADICVGFTMELGPYVKPSTIGCDIGCGMLSARFSGRTSMDLEKVDNNIRARVPMGADLHEEIIFDEIPFNEVQIIANEFVKKYNEKFGTTYVAPTYNEKWLTDLMRRTNMDERKFYTGIGTLGGGNHFIEIGKSDKTNDYWVTIHSGSRNFGIKIESYWTKVSKNQVFIPTKEYNEALNNIKMYTVPKSDIPKKTRELRESYAFGVEKAYLSGNNLMNYFFDMIFAQQYAIWNRKTMLSLIKKAVGVKKYDEEIHAIHNYVDFKDFIIRKGAIASYEGQKMVIPFNMRDGILICEGRSNEDWNFSAPHGAGRIMSRGKAKESVDLKDFKRVMKGIYSTSVCRSTLDESPFAYKNAETIEKAIEPTAVILEKVKPVLNIKDKSEGETWQERKANQKKAKQLKRERDEIAFVKMKRI